MKIKLIVLCVVLLVISGCLDDGIILNGKYVSNNSNTLQFSEGNIFYATEYMEFTQQTVELVGTYTVNNDELILTYKMFGAVRRFQISNNSHTLIENDSGKMRFDWQPTSKDVVDQGFDFFSGPE